MNLKICAVVICLVFTCSSLCQTLNTSETAALQRIIHNYFTSHVDISEAGVLSKANAPAEAFICVLNIDSGGKVVDLHFWGEEKYTDSAFTIFSKMSAINFNGCKMYKHKGKTLIIPILVPTRFMDVAIFKKETGLNAFMPATGGGNLIIVRGITLGWPYKIKE